MVFPGVPRRFIECNSFEYRYRPLKMNFVEHGYNEGLKEGNGKR